MEPKILDYFRIVFRSISFLEKLQPFDLDHANKLRQDDLSKQDNVFRISKLQEQRNKLLADLEGYVFQCNIATY